MTVSGHSGLREEVELRMLHEKAEEKKRIEQQRMETVCGVLDAMPPQVRRRFLAEIVRKYVREGTP